MVNRCRVRRIVCVTAALLAMALHAATSSAQTPPVRLLTTADGLVHDTVARIHLDSRGFLWFATIAGLARFDGRRIVNYSMSDGLPDLVVNDVYEDRRRMIWAATNGGGLARFRAVAEPGQMFDVFAVGSTERSNRVNRLIETADDRLWAATDEGLFAANNADPVPTFARVPLGDAVERGSGIQVLDVTATPDGTLWLASAAGLLRRSVDGRVRAYERPPGTGSAPGLVVQLTPDGLVWVGFNDGLGVWRLDDVAANRLLREAAGTRLDGVGALHIDADGALLVGTSSGGLVRIHDKDARVLWRSTARATQIRDFCLDRRNHLWIATSDGVGRMMRSGLVTWPKPLTSAEVTFQHLVEAAPGEILGMSPLGWIGRVKGDRLDVIQPAALAGSITATLVNQWPLIDREGQWWIGTGRGLYRFGRVPFERLEHARPSAVYRTADGLPSDVIGRLFEDHRGDIWIATLGLGGEVLARWQRATDRIRTFPVGDGLEPRNVPIAFAEDLQGRVWVTFRDGGLGRFSEDRFEMVSDTSIGRLQLQVIHFDRRGRLWLGGRGRGVLRVDDPSAVPWRIRSYSSGAGLLNEAVSTIVEDASGALYVGGQRGLERIDPDTHAVQMVAPASLVGSTFAALSDSAGNMWMAGLTGISRLTPSRDAQVPPPTVRIAAARLAGVPLPLSPLGVEDAGAIELAASRTNLQFEFVGLDHRLEGSLRYQARLIGAGDDWSVPTSEPTLTYASLAPGRYRFEVRAVNTSDEVSTRPAIATVIVHPPFWAQWWFRTAVALGVCALAYAWYRYRLGHALALERVRSRIATDLHDDIGADLSQIAILSEVVRRDVSATHPQASNRLSSIAATASGLVDSMSDIVWAINPGRDSMPDLVHRMRRFVSDTLAARNIAFRFEAPADSDAVSLGADARRNVYLVLKEAVHNIVRHAHASSVDIRLERDGRWLTLAVRDDGLGFDPAERASGTGLSSMRARVEALGGRLLIDSRPGGGTCVTLTVSCR